MELLGYKMVNDELMATVKSDHGHIFRYSFKIETPEYEILEVLKSFTSKLSITISIF